MLNFITHLFKKSEKPDIDSGLTEPQQRDLTPTELHALDTLLAHIFAHLNETKVNKVADRVREQFIAGESFSTAMSIVDTDADSIAYLAVDIKDAESAAGFAESLCIAHEVIPPFQIDHYGKWAGDILYQFDIWLTERGYRFIWHTDVDWAYEGFILPTSRIEVAINATKILGIGFALGCKEE